MTDLVNSKGTISFRNGNSYEYQFHDYIIQVGRINDDIVRVCFLNLQRGNIAVPVDTFHRDLQTGNIHNDFGGNFFITWNGRHEIITNGVTLIQFNNQRQVSVLSPCEHWVVKNRIGQVVRRDGQKVAAEHIQPVIVVAVQNQEIVEEEDNEDEE